MKIETLAVHAGRQIDTATAAVTPPIHLSTTYQRDADGGYARSFSYTRPDNPTRQQLREIVSGWGVRVDFVDPTHNLAELDAHLTPATRLIWIETPCNPTVRVTDIAAVAARARDRGALLVCDNTFATPIVQRPLELGADLVMHSSTKYFGGHSDVMGGAVVARERADAAAIRNYQGVAGAVPSPFDCWLIRRSLATLPMRVRAQCANALEIAEYLRRHARVERVFYPGLADDPGHAVAARQMHGFGGVLAVCVRGGAAEALAVAARTRVFIRATSLGGVESLIEHRASVEGPDTPTPPNLLRLSIGIENAQDLIADLEQALRGS
jgi:cystathionine gamma-synthase